MTDVSAPAPGWRPLLLIVDDDPLISDSLAYSLGASFEIITSHSRAHCVQLLHRLRHMPELALVDLGLPPTPHQPDEGFALIADLLGLAPQIKIVVLSGQSDADNARHARAIGAIDFVAKPCNPGDLLNVLHQALRYRALDVRPPPATPALIGESPAMARLRQQVRQYAESPFPVLIEGESGTGKEIVASRCLHQDTPRGNKPFLALNCAAISPTLVESTLFGYAKGAYTGATAGKAGYFEEAGDGTLFLDEVGELALELQAKLLRVLENGAFHRVGETVERHSRARIVAATNRDLRHEVRSGRFRADLYYRLSVCTIAAPPLREMGNDRHLLLDHYRALFATQAGQRPFTLDAAACALWAGYRFPGNVRELRNMVIRLTAKYPGRTIGAAELEAEFDAPDDLAPSALPPESAARPTTDQTGLIDAALARLQRPEPFSLDRLLGETEQSYIEAALRLTRGNVSQAARLLGVNRTTLYHRMETTVRPS